MSKVNYSRWLDKYITAAAKVWLLEPLEFKRKGYVSVTHKLYYAAKAVAKTKKPDHILELLNDWPAEIYSS